MKVQTKVKSGAINNHNETLTDNDGSIEREKSFIKKLIVNKETIRELKGFDLKRAVGGGFVTVTISCAITCSVMCIAKSAFYRC